MFFIALILLYSAHYFLVNSILLRTIRKAILGKVLGGNSMKTYFRRMALRQTAIKCLWKYHIHKSSCLEIGILKGNCSDNFGKVLAQS